MLISYSIGIDQVENGDQFALIGTNGNVGNATNLNKFIIRLQIKGRINRALRSYEVSD